MRARNIKPGVFLNEILGQADPIYTLLFEGLWCLSDKEGRLEDRPLRIKAEVFPYRDYPNLNGDLTQLERWGFIQRYEVGGLRIIQILNFKKHQSPHHTERKSELPENPNSCEVTVSSPLGNGGNPSDSLIPDSLIPDSTTPTPSPSAPVVAEVAEKPRKTKKPATPRNRDFLIAALEMPEPVALAFNRTWDGWAPLGWNYKTNTAGNRKTNRVEAAKRFWQICQHMTYAKADGTIIGPEDLADAALDDLAKRIKEARGQIPCVSGIVNFFSSCEGERHPWKEALVVHFGGFEEV